MSDVLCLHLDTFAMPDRVHNGALAPGARAGRYEVESFLGAGGMGEIYVARDTILGRRIALKVLPSGCDRDRIARFLREAKASSALNHPAIVSVHDAGSADGIHFLAMELIDGEPLSLWMKSHSDVTRATELMAQVADGLACAHAAGIVHRDLKPANIMIGRAGYAKIVDFGVAKLAERSVSPDDSTDMKTADGLLVGTAAYMSPEQVEGAGVDYRSDIFSFGSVLYELLTGVHPFAVASVADTIHNIAHLDPPLDGIPPQCRRIVARCLAKEPGRRYQSMADVAHDLRDSLSKTETISQRRSWPAWRMVAVALLFVGALLFLNRKKREVPAPEVTTRPLSMQQLTNGGKVSAATISPDGKFLVYAEQDRGLNALWVKQIATESVTRITPPSPTIYEQIMVSSDDNYVYYLAWVPPAFDKSVFQVPILGGEPREVVSKQRLGSGFALSPDGRHLAFFRFDGGVSALTIADIDGGGERKILTLTFPRWGSLPAWSPDGKKITFVEAATDQRDRHINEVFLQTRARRTVSTLSLKIQAMAWLPDGSRMVISAADVDRAKIWVVPGSGGAPELVTPDISSYTFATPTADGHSLVLVRGESSASITLLSVDPDEGTHVVSAGQLGDHLAGSIGWIDVDHIIYGGVVDGVPTLFVVPRRGGKPQQIIHGMSAWHPSVSPNGKRLAFISDRSGSPQVWVSEVDGTGTKQLTSGGYGVYSQELSGDATFVYYLESGGGVHRIPIGGGISEWVPVRPGPNLAISRDGRWLLTRPYLDISRPTWIFPLSVGGSSRSFDRPRHLPAYMRFHPSSRSFGFTELGKNGVRNIWLQNIDGGPPRQITHFDHGDIYAFDWSPDGKWLAVSYDEPKSDVVIIHNFR